MIFHILLSFFISFFLPPPIFSSLSLSLPSLLPPPPFRAIFCLLRFVQTRVSQNGENEVGSFFYSQIVEKYFVRANKCPLLSRARTLLSIIRRYATRFVCSALVRSHLRDDKIVGARLKEKNKYTECIKSTVDTVDGRPCHAWKMYSQK